MAAAVSWKPNFYKPKKTALENILKTISVNFHLNRSSCFGCRAGTKTLHGQTHTHRHRHRHTHTDTHTHTHTQYTHIHTHLYDVISVLILDESFGVGVKFVEDGRRLFGCAMLQNALNHPAAVGMRRERQHLEMKAGKSEL